MSKAMCNIWLTSTVCCKFATKCTLLDWGLEPMSLQFTRTRQGFLLALVAVFLSVFTCGSCAALSATFISTTKPPPAPEMATEAIFVPPPPPSQTVPPEVSPTIRLLPTPTLILATQTPKPNATPTTIVLSPVPTKSTPRSPSPSLPPTLTPKPTISSPGTTLVGAICMDGTTSDATGSGACSHHGGVKQWIYR